MALSMYTVFHNAIAAVSNVSPLARFPHKLFDAVLLTKRVIA